MERTSALKWFWPFMGVATLAAATVIAFPTFASKATFDEPQFRMLVKVNAQGSQIVALSPVANDPSCIGAKAKHSPSSLIAKVAGMLTRHPS